MGIVRPRVVGCVVVLIVVLVVIIMTQITLLLCCIALSIPYQCLGAGGSVGGGGGGGAGIDLAETEGVKPLSIGKPLLLSCNQTNGENVFWKRNGENLDGTEHIEIHKHNSSLYIAVAEKTDVGNYTCMPSQQTISVVYL